jgi:hypothetical protein
MPLTKLELRPGINKEGTTYSNEGGYYNCDKIRFRSGYAEKLGGWVNISPSYTYVGAARAMFNWVAYDTSNLLALGTSTKYYVENGGQYFDITPLASSVATTLGANPFSATINSKCVVVTHTSHGKTAGTYATFTSTAAVGGLTISGEYQIVEILSVNTYSIATPTAASSTGTGGGSVTVVYQINAGGSSPATPYGWGIAAWGAGGWGNPASVGQTIPLRLWSQDIYEQDLIFNASGANIYYWTKDTSTYARAVTLADKANGVTKVQFDAGASPAQITFTGGSSTLTVESIDLIDLGSVVSGSGIPSGAYVTALTSATTVTISQPTPALATPSGIYTFSYSGRNAPDRAYYVIASDTTHFTIALGSKPYDPTNFNPTFDPMLVRWSDQDNPYEWTPAITNQSGEVHLSNGSYLICAQNARQEILLWSDSALYSMQYIGPPYVWGFNLIGDNTSIISMNAAIAVNTVTYWMGVDKFYQYNGRLETLSCTLWKYVYDNLNKSRKDLVVCGSNEGFSEIWWFYPSRNSQVNDSYVIYNYLEQTWYYGTLNRTAWLDSPLRAYPMGAFSVQASYLTSSITDSATTITVVDATNYPTSGTLLIDSEQITYTGIAFNSPPIPDNTFTGCVRGVNGTTAAAHAQYSVAAYTTPNQVMFHENGVDDGSGANPTAINAYLESSDFDVGDGHNFGYVWRIIPDITFRGSTGPSPRVILTLKGRVYTTPSTTAVQDGLAGSASGSPYISEGTNPSTVTRTSVSSAAVETYTSEVFTRIRARQAAFRVESDTVGTAWQVGAMRIDVKQDGRR